MNEVKDRLEQKHQEAMEEYDRHIKNLERAKKGLEDRMEIEEKKSAHEREQLQLEKERMEREFEYCIPGESNFNQNQAIEALKYDEWDIW